MIDELKELIAVPGVSGFEDRIREAIRERAEILTRTRTDEMGNLYATVGKGERHLLLVAHMDELGMVVSKVEEGGFLRFRKVGGIDDRSLIGRVVEIQTEKGRVKGAIGLLPPHLMADPSKEMDKVLKSEDLRIDICCRSKREAEDLGIAVMDPIVFEKHPLMLNDNVLCTRGLDDRFGCFALLAVLRRVAKRRIGMRVTFVWSVQEEVGLRGAKVAALKERPDFVIAVDSCSSTDFPGAPEHLARISLGDGPVVRYMDNRSIASPSFVKFVRETAASSKLPLQIGISGGGTDGAAAQEFGSFMVPLCIPIRYTHSTVECIHLQDLRNLISLLEEIVIRL
ncbi:MAG: M42 family metallopeptidase, partial [Euryarchaeota archaeon]|nr:M42 family metallopeptidase [Euryarchaeota archaeon]